MKKKTATTTAFMNENRILHDTHTNMWNVSWTEDEKRTDQITEQK